MSFNHKPLKNYNVRTITLCADDYAQSEVISEGILQLVDKQRLSAVSCMTTSNYWPSYAKLLQPFAKLIDIGLHFNLTEGQPLAQHTNFTFKPIEKMLLATFLRRLQQTDIENEFRAQLTEFQRHFGRLPDFIDGHQHVHHLPIIRDAILAVYKQELATHKPFIRIAGNNYLTSWRDYKKVPKTLIITLSGALTLKKQLQQLDIPHNKSFSGVYNFANSTHYRQYFQYFLSQVRDGGLIMCHPGLLSNDSSDPLMASRHHEYQYLQSPEFLQDCDYYNIALSKHATSPLRSGGEVDAR